MGKPVIVLAGQSNAARLGDMIDTALATRLGADNYVLVRVYSAGAPLTRSRGDKSDWQDPTGDLRSRMSEATADALRDTPDSDLAGVLWVQGEADTYSIGAPGQYAAAFLQLLEEVQASVIDELGPSSGAGTFKAVVAGLADAAPAAAGRGNWQGIQSAQQALDAAHGWITTVNPDALADAAQVPASLMFQDDLHYSDVFGAELADALVETLIEKAGATAAFQRGSDGDDIFAVLEGPNLMVGGLGDDTYHVDNSGDRLIELAGEGADVVLSSVSLSLRQHSQHIENLELTGASDIDATGNALANTITGNAGNNLLNGAWGDDLLIGGAGNDTFRDQNGADRMIGGAGDDIYYIDNRRDVIEELAGGGQDVVRSSISLGLRSFGHEVEELYLLGAADLDGTGNGADNILRGNRGENVLYGGWGDDLLAGGAGRDLLGGGQGNDRMIGGSGPDTFLFQQKFGHDVIDDFNAFDGEVIDLSDIQQITGFDDLIGNHATQTGNGVLIRDGAGNHLTLRGVDLDDLSDGNFLF